MLNELGSAAGAVASVAAANDDGGNNRDWQPMQPQWQLNAFNVKSAPTGCNIEITEECGSGLSEYFPSPFTTLHTSH
jgi:hypothetical protein